MRRITVSKAFARQIEATNAGKIAWPTPTPATKPLTAKEIAEYEEALADPHVGDAYGRHLSSGNDFLSRLKAAQTKQQEDSDGNEQEH